MKISLGLDDSVKVGKIGAPSGGTPQSPPTAAMGYRVRWPVLDNNYCYSDAGTTKAVNTDPVQQWNDALVVVASSNLSQATLGLRPIFTTGGSGGKSYLAFDGTDDTFSNGLTIDNYMAVGASTVTLALNIRSGYTTGSSIMRDASAWWRIMHITGNVIRLSVYDGASKDLDVSFTPGTPFVVSFKHDTGKIYGKKNNGAWSAGVTCGNRGGSTAFQMVQPGADVDLYDASLANVVVSDANIALVHGYLMSQLGIA